MDLNQVTLPTRDAGRAVAFYRKLGFTLIVDSAPRYVRFELPFGHATLSLEQVEGAAWPTGVTVYLECEDLDERVARLQDEGLVFEHGPVDQRWGWREARLADPDGNRLCLYRAGTNRRNPPWRVKT